MAFVRAIQQHSCLPNDHVGAQMGNKLLVCRGSRVMIDPLHTLHQADALKQLFDEKFVPFLEVGREVVG